MSVVYDYETGELLSGKIEPLPADFIWNELIVPLMELNGDYDLIIAGEKYNKGGTTNDQTIPAPI